MPRLHDLRSLPPQVLSRLSEDPFPGVDVITTFTNKEGHSYRMEERRAPIEVRTADDGSPIIEGYATTYNTRYDVWGGPPWGWTEMIAEGACDRAVEEGDDTRLLFNHDDIAMARTKSGTLTLESDKLGLHVFTPRGLDLRMPAVQNMVYSMERGDTDEMSFAFVVDKDDKGHRMETWNEDFTERIIYGVRLFDVSVVTYPANPATLAVVRGDKPAEVGMPLHLSRALAEAL